MTDATLDPARDQKQAGSSDWLVSPAWDLLVGCGLAYMAVFGVLVLAGQEVAAAIPLGLMPLGALVLSTPHYGATLLRVYSRREDRQRYAAFSTLATAAIAVLFVAGLYRPSLGCIVLTVYLTWSPWHYSGQNYGIASMFLRRRGLSVTPGLRRSLYATFVLSSLMAILVIHLDLTAAGTYAPNAGTAGAFRFVPIGFPAQIGLAALAAGCLAYLILIGIVVGDLLKQASVRTLVPVFALLSSQALWFVVPVVARQTGVGQGLVPLSLSTAEYAFWWIALAHAAQYLWITAFYATRDRGMHALGFYGKSLLAGSAIWGIPALIFGTSRLGPVAFDQGLFLMIAATVNIHHFVLDGAIWKLRDGRVARILLRSVEDAQAAVAPRARPWLGYALLGIGAICALQTAAYVVENEFGVNRATARGDEARLAVASDRLAAIGYESATPTLNRGILLGQAGEHERARAALYESIEIQPTALAWTALGQTNAWSGDLLGSVAALEAALDLDPDQFSALHQLGVVEDELGRLGLAQGYLERAVAVAPTAERRGVVSTRLADVIRRADEAGTAN